MGAVFVVLKGGVTMDREREAPGITNRDGRRWHCQTSREMDLALRPRHDEGRREEVALPAAIGFDGHHEIPAEVCAMKSNFNLRFVDSAIFARF